MRGMRTKVPWEEPRVENRRGRVRLYKLFMPTHVQYEILIDRSCVSRPNPFADPPSLSLSLSLFSEKERESILAFLRTYARIHQRKFHLRYEHLLFMLLLFLLSLVRSPTKILYIRIDQFLILSFERRSFYSSGLREIDEFCFFFSSIISSYEYIVL